MYVNIQFLRFVAAFMVLLYHAVPATMPGAGQQGLAVIRLFGFAGVDIFFVISGFIIWHTTESAAGGLAAGRFALKRAARIYLGYWPFFVLAALLPMLMGKQVPESVRLFESALLLPIPIPERVLPVSWTLTFELYFYLCFTLLLFLPKTIRVRLLLGAALVILLSILVGGLVFNLYDKKVFSGVDWAWRLPISPYNLEFICGALVAAFASRFKPAHWPSYLAIALLFVAGGAWYNQAYAGAELDKGYEVVARVWFFGIAAILLLLAMMLLERGGIKLFSKASTLLGGASYSLYLSHTLIIGLYASTGRHEMLDLPLLLGVAILYSATHYVLLEKPLYRAAVRTIERFVSSAQEDKADKVGKADGAG